MDLLGVTFRDTITLGSIIVGIAIGLPAIFAIIWGAKSRANAQVAEETVKVLQEGREVYKQASERLGAEKDEALARIATLETEVTHLRSYPFGPEVAELVAASVEKVDVQASERTKQAAGLLSKQHEQIEKRMVDSFATHERRAQERHESEMRACEAIIDKLNGG